MTPPNEKPAPEIAEELAGLEALLAKATPGPWLFYHRFSGNEDVRPAEGPDEIAGLGWDWDNERGNMPPEPMRGVFANAADAALVEAARNALPRLIAHIRATSGLAAEVERLRGEAARGFNLGYAEAEARAQAAERSLEAAVEVVRPFAALADEWDRWQAKGSTSTPNMVRMSYGRCRFGLEEYRAARTFLAALQKDESNG